MHCFTFHPATDRPGLYRYLFLFVLFIFSQQLLNAQLKVKKLELAFYSYNGEGTGTAGGAELREYYYIDQAGTVFIHIIDDEDTLLIKAKLSSIVTSQLNRVFDGKQKLKDMFAPGMPEAGTKYGAPVYSYTRITGSNNNTEQLCFTDELMKESFNEMVSLIVGYCREQNPGPAGVNRTSAKLTSDIAAVHRKSKYLAQESGPLPMEQ